MDIFSIDLTHNELNFIRQSLETVTIQRVHVQFLIEVMLKI